MSIGACVEGLTWCAKALPPMHVYNDAMMIIEFIAGDAAVVSPSPRREKKMLLVGTCILHVVRSRSIRYNNTYVHICTGRD